MKRAVNKTEFKLLALLLICLFLSGCAAINFSTLYYKPPPNYEEEAYALWNNVKATIPLRADVNYSFSIVSDKATVTAGVPQNNLGSLEFPELYVKYIYQYYYNDRFIILTCIIVHELAHTEFNLPAEPPETHYLVDQRAITLLTQYTSYGINEYYSSLVIMDNYWSARKGLIGNTLNVAYNLAVLCYGGLYVDWISNDLDTRLMLLVRDYSPQFVFKRYKPLKAKTDRILKKDKKQSMPKSNISLILKPLSEEASPKKSIVNKIRNKTDYFKKELTRQKKQNEQSADATVEQKLEKIVGKTAEEVEEILGEPISSEKGWGGKISAADYEYKGKTITVFFDNRKDIVTGWSF